MKNATSTTAKSSVPSKIVNIIARVKYKEDARKVVYFSRSSDGQTRYQTSLFDGKATSCECPAIKPCYHMDQCQAIESARIAHIAEHGTLEGFSYIAPEAEKKERKARTTFAPPTTVEAMVELRAQFESTTVEGKRRAIAKVFGSMAVNGDICVGALKWHFDGETIFEVVIVPSLSAECVVVSEECTQEHRDDYREWLDSLITETGLCKVCGEKRAVSNDGFCSVDCAVQAEIAGIDEYRVGDDVDVSKFADMPVDEQEFEEELTKAQVILCVRDGLRTLTDSDPDHASKENGVGPNGLDTEFCHDLVSRHELSPKQIVAAAKMLQKYNKTQLGGRVPTVATVQKALGLSPKAPLPQAPFSNERSEMAPLNGQRGFSILR